MAISLRVRQVAASGDVVWQGSCGMDVAKEDGEGVDARCKGAAIFVCGMA